MFSARFEDLTLALRTTCYTFQGKSLEEGDALAVAIQTLKEVKKKGNKVFVLGNGGSAGIASHFGTDLMKTLHVPSYTLYDPNLLTCLSNDLGYENVFSFPLSKLIAEGDVLVAISSSGKSLNIIKGAEAAREKGAFVFALSGFLPENPLRALGHLDFWVDRSDYGLVEMAHFFLLHTIVDLWDQHADIQFNNSLRTSL